jgi:2-dehydro-3-deoxyphosphooctonate aldolase (KDO 8-P synthase)
MSGSKLDSVELKGVSVGDILFQNRAPIKLIAGPCSLESRDMALRIAEHLQNLSLKKKIPFIFKASFDKANRTSLSKRGIGMDTALRIFEEIKKTYRCPIMTDVHLPTQCSAVADVADVLQIPAFLCRQTDLIQSAAKTGKTLNIKKGQFISPEEMIQVARKAEESGGKKILLCERGFSFGYNNLVNDMRGLATMAQSGWPVIFDATHSVQRPGGKGHCSGGDRHMVEALARAATAVGVAGLFMETHFSPETALSDGPNMVPLHHMEELISTLIDIDACTKERKYCSFSTSSF